MNDSDWWSVLGKYNSIDFSQAGVKHVAPAPSNFKILNVLLGIKQFDAVVDELGETSSIERGDAALGRTQMCYVSASHSPQVHLIFEQGSEGSVFARYLFENGPTWEGDNSCTPSNQISARMQTANGLRLGDSEAKAEAVLGKPTKASGDALIYVYEVKKKTSLTAFIRER